MIVSFFNPIESHHFSTKKLVYCSKFYFSYFFIQPNIFSNRKHFLYKFNLKYCAIFMFFCVLACFLFRLWINCLSNEQKEINKVKECLKIKKETLNLFCERINKHFSCQNCSNNFTCLNCCAFYEDFMFISKNRPECPSIDPTFLMRDFKENNLLLSVCEHIINSKTIINIDNLYDVDNAITDSNKKLMRCYFKGCESLINEIDECLKN